MDIGTILLGIGTIIGIVAGVVQILDYLQKRREKEASMSELRPLSQLRQTLVNHFSEGELQTLCFDLVVDYDDLPGETKADKARELVAYLHRCGRIQELVDVAQSLRPQVVWGDVRQALDVGIDSQLGSPTPKILHNLPPRAEFVGRERERKLVHEAILSRSHLACICGIGGIGKTALALEVAYECLQNSRLEHPIGGIATFEGIIWATAKDRDLTLNDVLDAIAVILEYRGIAEKPIEEKRSAVCQLLQEKPFLLVVDNCEAIADRTVFDFLYQLPEPSEVLVTTRERTLTQGQIIWLEDLDDREALALIRSEGKRLGLASVEHADDQLLLRLYQSTSGAPLAIKWAVGQIGQRGQSMDTVLASLRKAKAGIFDSIFARSWELLSLEAQQVIAVIPFFAAPASRAAIEAISNVHNTTLDEAMAQLIGMSLLDVAGDLMEPRYSIHPLTRAYVERVQETTGTSRWVQDSFECMLTYYKQLVSPPEDIRLGDPYWDGLRNYAGIQSLNPEWPNLNHLIRQALSKGYDRDALDLFLSIVHLMNAWGAWEERLQLGYQLCEVAARLGDPVEAWLWIDALSWILRRRRQFQKGKEAVQKGRSVAHKFNLENALILADTCEASLYREQGDSVSARRKLDAVLAQVELDSVLERDPIYQIVIGRLFGIVSAQSYSEGDFVQAMEWADRELKLRSAIGENVGPILARLGRTSIMLDDIPSASKFLEQAQATAGPKDIALINYAWALISEKKRDYQEARHLCKLATEQYTRLGIEGGVQECQELAARLTKADLKQ